MSVRIISILALSLAVSVLLSNETIWRLEHPLSGQVVHSQNNSKIAEVRFMPEGSAVPYGQGVFLRDSSSIFHSLQATLVFAGYCKTLAPRWMSEEALMIECALIEGRPYVPSAVSDRTNIKINVYAQRGA